MKKYFLITFGILLSASYLSVAAQGVHEEAVPLAISFERPNFSPTKDWSLKYVNLFKQAIKEKYSIDDKTLNENFIIQSVVKGTQVDGVASASSREDIGNIHYIYKIQWAYFNGYGPQNGLSFVIKDSSGNDLTDEQILENIKKNLIPVFTIKSIISEKDAINKCGGQSGQLFPPLRAPFYASDNNILFDASRKDLIFFCSRVINAEENKCLREAFSLQTGEKFLSQEIACTVQDPHTKPVEGTLPEGKISNGKRQPVTEEAIPTGSYPEQVLNRIGDRVWNYKVALTATLIILLTVGSFIVGLRSSKKIVKVPLILVGVIGTFIFLNLLYNFFVLGQKDFGILYQYSYCENGIYSVYPRGIVDGGTAYYNKQGEKLGWCDAWGVAGDKCKETAKSVGTCKERSMFGW